MSQEKRNIKETNNELIPLRSIHLLELQTYLTRRTFRNHTLHKLFIKIHHIQILTSHRRQVTIPTIILINIHIRMHHQITNIRQDLPTSTQTFNLINPTINYRPQILTRLRSIRILQDLCRSLSRHHPTGRITNGATIIKGSKIMFYYREKSN